MKSAQAKFQSFDFTRNGQPWPALEIVKYASCIAGVSAVAKRLNVTERTVWRWFNDQAKPRDEKKIRRRMRTLKVDASGAHFGKPRQ